MKTNLLSILLLITITCSTCNNDNDFENMTTKELSDNWVLTWDCVDGRVLTAEYHEDFAFVVIKGESYWSFKKKMDEQGIGLILPYSYYKNWTNNLGPFDGAVRAVLDTDYRTLLDMEELLFAGPCVKGAHWSSGYHTIDGLGGVVVQKIEDQELSQEQESFLDKRITPIYNYVYGTCDTGNIDSCQAFLNESNVIVHTESQGRISIYLTKSAKYDVLSLTKTLNQRFGKFSFYTASDFYEWAVPADTPKKPFDCWWSRSYTEPIFGRFLGVKEVTPGNYLLKEGRTLVFDESNGSLNDFLDQNGKSVMYSWENDYLDYYLAHCNDTGFEENPEDFYKLQNLP